MRCKETNERSAMWFSLAFGATMMISSAVFALVPKDAQRVAVVTWPWNTQTSAIHVIARADAKILSAGRLDWIAIASDNQPQLNARLYEAGATFVVDAAFIIACGGVVTKK